MACDVYSVFNLIAVYAMPLLGLGFMFVSAVLWRRLEFTQKALGTERRLNEELLALRELDENGDGRCSTTSGGRSGNNS